MKSSVQAADVPSRPSKVRNAVLPQEYNLFRLLSNASFEEESWSVKTPACEWKLVQCNPEGQVTNLNWRKDTSRYAKEEENVRIKGVLRWDFLPDTLLSFSASNQAFLEGHVDLSVLPAGLKNFDIGTNRFNGGLDLTHLPSTLEKLVLNFNLFEGEVDLTHLPDGLRILDLAYNTLRGEPDLTKLPEFLTWARLLHNNFVIPDVVPACVHIKPHVPRSTRHCGYSRFKKK